MDERVDASPSSKVPPFCPICLDYIKDEAYLDRCFHSFCYQCITNWTTYASLRQSGPLSCIKCPLCKSENLSIIHGFSGNFYLQHFVNQPIGKGCLTRAHVCRWLCYEKEPGMLNDKFSSQSFWKSRRYLRKNQFLQVWLRREIQTLLQEEDVDVIVYHILGVIESFFKSQQKTYYPQLPPEDVRKNFKKLISDAARTFLSSRTDRFVDELELFLASGLTLDAYDMVYMEHLYLKPSLSTSNLRPAEEEDSKLVESND
ncbi:RING/U-box superfamily protein isoform X1 [Wolffia australiana]